MWRRAKYRVIYWFLSFLRWLAQLFPNLKVPRWVPLAGRVDDRSFAPPLKIKGGRRLGKSMTVPVILRIEIDGAAQKTTPAMLQPVATRLFRDYPPFTFNVSFACGAARMFRRGVYGDPSSHWFNVFAGYYEIDVAKDVWTRPFGYRLVDGAWQVATEDLGRLGSADWNYFSNFMYGVPLDAIEPVDQPTTRFKPTTSITLAGRRWDHLRADRMRASTAYLAHSDKRELVDSVIGLTDIWRCVYGMPFRGTDGDQPTSFFPTDMRAAFYACFVEDETQYRTFIFGGTANQWWERDDPARVERNREFLGLQMSTIGRLIEAKFAHLGFDADLAK